MTDTKLSAACSLHTASGSTSSSTSSRKKRLVEIAEEDEDDLPPSKRKSLLGDLDLEPPKTPADPSWNTDPVTLNADLASSPEQSKFSAQDTADPPTFVGADHRPSTSDSHDRSISSSSSAYPYGKPKVKLGPRPSHDVNIRPQTAGNFRPVSAIPAGYKLFGKGSKRTKSRESNILVSPQEEIAALDFGADAQVEADDASKENTDPALAQSTAETPLKPAKKISPEKARLKKAMQLREKKRLAAAKAAQEGDDDTVPAEVAEAEPADDAHLGDDELNAEATTEEAHAETLSVDEQDSLADAQSTCSLADQTSELTATDSHPASPALGDSEAAHSTKASSISDATEETLHEKDDDAGDKTPDQQTAILEAVASIPDADHSNMTSADHIKATEAALFGPADAAADITEEPVAIPISKFSTNNSNSPTADEPMPELPVESTQDKEPAAESNNDEKTTATTAPPTAPPTAIPTQPSAQDLLAATRAAAEPRVETPTTELTKSPPAALESVVPTKNQPAIVEPEVKESVVEPTTITSADPEIKEPVVEAKSNDTNTEPEKDRGWRKGLVNPIQTNGIENYADQNRTPTGANLSINEPVTPITPGSVVAALPHSASTTPQPFVVRTVSNPVRGNLIPPSDVSQSSAARSMSSGAAYLHRITQQQQSNANLSSKSNVGSSISQRIKALEKLSASGGAEIRPSSRERPQSTFFSVKKSEPLRAPSVIERANSLRMTAPPSRDGSESSPETSRPQRRGSGSVSNRLSMFQPLADSPLSGGPESISVTAKIVRDPNHQMPEHPRDATGFNPLDLKQSPLFVSHQKPSHEVTTTTMDSSIDSLKDDGRRSSMSLVRGLRKEKRTISQDSVPSATAQSPPPPSGSFSPRLSFSSRRSTGREGEEGPQSPGSADGTSGGEDRSGDKLSRASRFMRRLSTLSGSRSKNTLPSAPSKTTLVAEDEPRVEVSRPSTTGTSPSIVSFLGDVNVQFPDNLLWKRRNLCLDSQGFLVLSALPAASSRAAQGTKRYHLSEFRQPYCPDVEVQELPNSVVLDFIEGTSLQLACEDRSGQMSVLKDLIEAHGKHAEQFGQ